MKVEESISDLRLRRAEKALLDKGLLKFARFKKGSIGPNGIRKCKKPINILLHIVEQNKYSNTLYAINGRKECDSWRARSQGDLFRLMRYYYPDITFKNFRVLLFELVNKGSLYLDYCGNIEKRVIRKHGSGCTNRTYTDNAWIGGSMTVDEFGFDLRVTH